MIRNALLGVLLVSLASGSMALTIGRPNGAVVLGQPLALSFDVKLDSEDNADSACVEVEVMQGDARVDPSRVRVSTSAQGQNARVQVKTTSPVEEPVVSVNVRAGCTQRVSRHYEFLSDFPGESRALAPSVAAVPVSVASLPPATPDAASADRSPVRNQRVAAPGAGVVSGALPAAPRKPRAERPVRPRDRNAATGVARPSAGAKPSATAAAPRPRLQLDAADSQVLPVREAGLKSSAELSLPAASAPAERASAAAQWRAMNTQAGDIPDPGRLAALEASVQALQAASARDRASAASRRGLYSAFGLSERNADLTESSSSAASQIRLMFAASGFNPASMRTSSTKSCPSLSGSPATTTSLALAKSCLITLYCPAFVTRRRHSFGTTGNVICSHGTFPDGK